jgi:ATP-binding cassette, subfamily C (CFTR/MRP), member 1
VLSHDTEVGEGGSSLSGGQRARVALARALYSGADTAVFLIDDCLAALDARVGSTVFDRVTKRLRDSGAATVLVTNDPNLPRRCDRVVLMQKMPSSSSCSYIADVGTYDDLLRRGHSLQPTSREEVEEQEDDVTDHKLDGEIEFDISAAGEIEPNELISRLERTARVTQWERDATELHCCSLPQETGIPLSRDFIAKENCLNKQINDGDELQETFNEEETRQPADMKPGPVSTMASDEKATDEKKARRLVSADDVMAAGAVPRSAYVTYFKSVRKPLLVVAMLAAYVMANGAQFFQQWTVAKWTELGRGDSMAAALGAKYLRSLVNAAGVVSICLWVRSFLVMRVGVRASEFLHGRMLSSVFAAPMSFFDATPSGQLLSRFGKEIETVDKGVPDSIGAVLFCFLQIFMSTAALAGVVTPAMMIPLAAVGTLYVKTMARFRPGARDLKRLETRTRSPIYTHFGEGLRGTEMIRSIPGSPQFWSSTHRNLTDTNLRSIYTMKALDRWLSCRLETLGNIVVLTAALASVWLTRAGRLKAGSAGWGLTQALAITGLMTWAVRCLTDLESNMMSVVRVKEMTDLESTESDMMGAMDAAGEETKRRKIPKEYASPGEALASLLQSGGIQANITLAPVTDEGLDDWPWHGDVLLNNVSMRYNALSPLVLKGITLDIPRGTTLGVVGRSGSGKSSLLLTLFRLVEIEVGGKIEIDGVDIRSISLQKLRGGNALAVIAQGKLHASVCRLRMFSSDLSVNIRVLVERSRFVCGLCGLQFRRHGQGVSRRHVGIATGCVSKLSRTVSTSWWA